jgi:hypothetical protein
MQRIVQVMRHAHQSCRATDETKLSNAATVWTNAALVIDTDNASIELLFALYKQPMAALACETR